MLQSTTLHNWPCDKHIGSQVLPNIAVLTAPAFARRPAVARPRRVFAFLACRSRLPTRFRKITMSLKARISDDMKAAMRARETERLGTIRLLLAAIKQREVDERIELDDTAVLAVVDKMLKQRKDSITQFQQAGRDDLVQKEQAEVDVLKVYMPAALSDAEIAAEVQQAVADTGAAGPQDMGKVMGVLKPKLAGRADMTAVSALVKAALAR